MSTFLDQFSTLVQFLSGHLELSMMSLLVGVCISIPIGIYASRHPKLENWITGVVGVVQTIPSLALLALMVPLLGGMIGWWPAFLALIVYSMLPIVHNTLVGIRKIEPELIEAANGLGIKDRQRLFWIELPLAFPIIITGIRTSAVLTVGTATLATPVGAESLGYYIFMGLNTRQPAITLFGCLFAALAAVVLDQAFQIFERAILQRKRRFQLAVATLPLVLFAFFPVLSKTIQGATLRIIPSIAIGSKDFTEQYVLAHLLKFHLEKSGLATEVRQGLGSQILFDALRQNQVDVYVDYTGTIWAMEMKRSDSVSREQALNEVCDFLLNVHSIECAARLGFENAYAFAMKRKHALQLGIRSMEDLKKLAPQFSLAADFDFLGRTEGKHVLKTYGLSFKKSISMNPRLMYDAIGTGAVDVVAAITTDGEIDLWDLTLLEDPRQAFPPYDAIVLVSPKARQNKKLMDSLRELTGKIDAKNMRATNHSVDHDGIAIPSAALSLIRSMDQK